MVLSSFRIPSNYFILASYMVTSMLVLTTQNLSIEATPNETNAIRLNGPIISLQFSDDGSASWIVSGRWRVDLTYDINGIIPQSVKNLSASLTMISADGLVTKRYTLSDFKVDNISYDNQTHVSITNGTLKMVVGTQSIDSIRASLKLFERNMITITLDPSKTKDYFGDTPIYGVER